MKTTPFAVRPYRDSARPHLKWVATGPHIKGKRWRLFFETKKAAEACLDQKKVERENQGAEGLEFPTSLRITAQDADAALAPFGKTIRDAVAFYLPTLRALTQSVPVEQLVKEVLAAKERDGKSPRYLDDLRSRLGIFQRQHEKRLVASFYTKEIDAWLRGLPEVSGLTRNHFRRALHLAFGMAKNSGYCSDNPVSATAKAKVKRGETRILTVEQAASLLASADAETLPTVVVGLFAGLRSAEIEKLDWQQITFSADGSDSGRILVLGNNAKSARRRLVELSPNAVQWLRPHRKVFGPVSPENFRVKMEATRTRAKIADWPPNALRHSFASYHLAQHGDAAKTALALGHADARILFEHYRSLVMPEDANRYWKLSPAEAENVVPFAAAAS